MSVPSIEKLPDELINQIKAGEVVERPASVVKELVENSIDAKASLVHVELLDGGKQLIRITDNGTGIAAGDVALALERHATSKIKNFSDLEKISSFGFRGEALPSIASVSEFLIKSKTAEQNSGREIIVSHGKIVSQKDVTMANGTVIQAKDLFCQVPARLKFLKSTSTEFSHIHDFLLSVSFYYYSVSMRLTHNGREVFSYNQKESSQHRFEEILRSEAHDYASVHYERGSFKVTGFSLLPHKATSLPQYFVTFVNGRLVKDKVIRGGVLQAYQGLLIKGLVPSCVIFVDVDPTWIDVNVHPAKTEVRFTDPLAVQELIAIGIQNSIKNKLNANLAAPKPTAEYAQTHSMSAKTIYAQPTGSTPLPNRQTYVEMATQTKPRPHTSNLKTSARSFLPQDNFKGVEPTVAPFRVDTRGNREEPDAAIDGDAESLTRPSPSNFKLFEEPSPSLFSNAQYLGQYSNCYLILQVKSELWFVDQHAFHERILFEEYTKEYAKYPISKQNLLSPFIVSSAASISAVAQDNKDKISNLGFEIEILKDNNIAIHSYPSFLSTQKIPSTFDELLGKLMALSGIPQGEVHPILDKAKDFSLQQEIMSLKNTQVEQTQFYHLFYATLACHTAVRAGDALNAELVQRLLARSTHVDFFAHCPHGRPVLRKFSQKDVEAWFLRI